MEAKYIVAIVAGSVFFVLLVIFTVFFIRKYLDSALQQQRLNQMYSDKNLVKMEYDYCDYDEDTKKILSAKAERRKQMSFNDIYPSAMPSAENSPSVVDADGLEEITGNYKPD